MKRIYVIYVLIALPLIVLAILGVATISHASWANSIKSLPKILFYADILYLMLSFKTVGPTELGLLTFLGNPLENVSSGWHFVPFGIYRLLKETRLVIQRQFPAEPEDIDKTGADVPAPGKVFPIRVTHNAPTAAEIKAGDPLSGRLTSETTFLDTFAIIDFLTFYTTIGSVDEACRQIRDTGELVVKLEFAKRTPATTLMDLEAINIKLKDKVNELTKDWGIKNYDVNVIEVDLGKTINTALRNLIAAEIAKKETVAKAQGEKEKLILEGEGKAIAEGKMLKTVAYGKELLLKAEAIGMEELKKLAGTDAGKVVLWLKTMEEGFKKSQHTIIPGGDLFNAMAGINAILKQKP